MGALGREGTEDALKYYSEDQKGREEEIYKERKELIKTSDKILIQKSLEKGQSFPDETAHELVTEISDKRRVDYFKKVLNNKPLYDIGCGREGNWNALRIKEDRGVGWYDKKKWEDETVFKISKQILVDPFLDEKYMAYRLEGGMKTMDVPEDMKEKIRDEITFKKKDGLSFLLEKEKESGNSMVASIDYSLISSNEYLKRIAQEIFRITPRDGVLISCNSPEIENEARHLFPYHETFSVIEVFSKSPIPSEKELDKKWEEEMEEEKRLRDIDSDIRAFFKKLQDKGMDIRQLKETYLKDESLLNKSADEIFTAVQKWFQRVNIYKSDAESKSKYYSMDKIKDRIKKFLEQK